MFANDPNLYGLTYRDFPVRPPFLGTLPPWENIPRFGLNPWETLPRFVPPTFGVTPWETLPRFVPPFYGMSQIPYNAPPVPFMPYLHAGAVPPFAQPNVNLPCYSFCRPFGV